MCRFQRPFFILLILLLACLLVSCGHRDEGSSAVTTASSSLVSSTTTANPTTILTPSSTIPAPTVTTTAVPDTTPPTLAVTRPRAGATLTESIVRFEGTVEPGCVVIAAGRYPADLAADGSWEVVLVLNPGSNVAVFEAGDAAGNRTEVRLVVNYAPALALAADGLGAVSFGDPMEETLVALVANFGPPSEDNIVESPFGTDFPYGYSATDYLRPTTWDEPVSLSVVFSDYAGYFRTDGLVHFINWDYRGDELVTSSGQGVGATVVALKDEYGPDFRIHPHCLQLGACDWGE